MKNSYYAVLFWLKNTKERDGSAPKSQRENMLLHYIYMLNFGDSLRIIISIFFFIIWYFLIIIQFLFYSNTLLKILELNFYVIIIGSYSHFCENNSKSLNANNILDLNEII